VKQVKQAANANRPLAISIGLVGVKAFLTGQVAGPSSASQVVEDPADDPTWNGVVQHCSVDLSCVCATAKCLCGHVGVEGSLKTDPGLYPFMDSVVRAAVDKLPTVAKKAPHGLIRGNADGSLPIE